MDKQETEQPVTFDEYLDFLEEYGSIFKPELPDIADYEKYRDIRL